MTSDHNERTIKSVSIIQENPVASSRTEEFKERSVNRYHAGGGIVINYVDGDWRYLVLLQRNKNGELQWVCPKGKIEKGETPLMAASREIDEETGLKSLELITSLGSQVFPFFIKVRNGKKSLIGTFSGQIIQMSC